MTRFFCQLTQIKLMKEPKFDSKKNETEKLSLSPTKNCETLIKQTKTKTQEILEFKLNKSR